VEPVVVVVVVVVLGLVELLQATVIAMPTRAAPPNVNRTRCILMLNPFHNTLVL